MLFVLSVIIGVAFELSWTMPIKYYASRYDHIDVESILNNRRLVKSYAQCLLSRGPCPPQGIEFKRILPEALQTNCARCTEKQKTVTLRVIKRLKKEYPKIWAELSEQWDPDDIFINKFELTFKKKVSPQIDTQSTAASEAPQVFNRFADVENNIPGLETAIPVSSLSTSIFSSSTSTPLTSTRSISVPQEPEPKPSISSPIIETVPSYPRPSSTVSSSSTSSTRASTPTTTRSRTTSGQTYTNKSLIVTISTTNVPSIRQNIGANIEATVSLGTNIVDGLVRSLGAIGSRVVETGAEIAEVVFRNLSKPL